MRKTFILLLATVLTIGACTSSSPDKNSKSLLDTSLGKTGEMLIVMSSGAWESELGDTIRALINETSPWLAVEEPQFEVSWVTPEYFTGLYQKYRNVLIVEIDEYIADNELTTQSDALAKPQSIVKMKVKDIKEGRVYYASRHEQIMQIFKQRELDRVVGAYKGIQDNIVMKDVRERFGFEMVIPKGFYVATNDSDFIWLRKPTRHIDEGILIYRYPYSDTSDFNTNEIIRKRNEITQVRVPGPIDSSYMKVSYIFPPYSETTTFKGQYAKMVRSWWDVEKYPMGGPYLSYTFVDTSGQNLICIDGYVHAPKKPMKRDIILHLEAIFDSFKYTE